MAIQMSENQLNYARKKFYGKFYVIKDNLSFFDKLINKFLIYLYLIKYSLVNMKRKFFRYINLLFAKENKEIIEFSLNLNDNSIEKISHDLRTKNFSYIENFMSKESHKYLLNNWPDINYFNHNKKIIKHYNSKAEWSSKNSQSTLSGSQNLKKFYSYLLSGEFKKFFDKLISFENKDYKLCAISASMASNDSYLIPHIDGVIKNKEQKKKL